MTTIVKISEAKIHLSELLERVKMGEEIVIAEAGKPVAGLSPIADKSARPFQASMQVRW
jgi:prevent-host-death family protein